jgi:hypothetical protein
MLRGRRSIRVRNAWHQTEERPQAQQNADKFRACARASSASACRPLPGLLPSAFDMLNVHPACPFVNTLIRDRHPSGA